MTSNTKSNFFMTGLAMFSMFFGAGNVVFPLALGTHAQDNNFFAIIGLLITGVGVPFLGLMTMTLFNGDYKAFFERLGKIPAYFITLILLLLIGPFGAIPRCVVLAYATVKIYIPQVDLITFSILSCILIFLFTFRKNKILDLLGYVLTPVLLGSLGLIVIMGLWSAPEALPATETPWASFIHGLTEGYQLLDLPGAFFFSSVVLNILEQSLKPDDRNNVKKMILLTLKAGCVGVSLLALTYIGFSYVAAFHSGVLTGVSTAEIISVLANHILGPYAGVIAAIAVALACLTTAIALAVVFAEFLHEDLSQEKISYVPSLLITLAVTLLFSMLNFNGIVAVIAPILHLIYPALIMLSFLNLLYKLYNFKPVKIPVFIVFFLSVLSTIFW